MDSRHVLLFSVCSIRVYCVLKTPVSKSVCSLFSVFSIEGGGAE